MDARKKKKKSYLHIALVLIAANVVGLGLMEGVARLLASQGLIPFKHYPTSEERTFLDDINPYFGVWRYPQRETVHTSPCFRVTYQTNDFGMRDNDIQVQRPDTRRMVVLGDSFVEGYGVEEEKRFTEVAQEHSGIEMLNFGTSGDFSSTQQYLVYKHLAKKFDHSSVSIFFLPSNDFRDNDPKNFGPKRYRPYLRKAVNGDYEVYYPVSFEERERGIALSPARAFRRRLYNNIYLLNAFRQLGDVFERSEFKDALTDPFVAKVETSYNDYTPEDLEKLVWGYRKIAQEAMPRPVTIFIIPREVDFLVAEQSSHHTKLESELEAMIDDLPNVEVHDLLPIFERELAERKIEHDDIFHSCDGHWSETGHNIAAEALLEAIEGNA